MLGGGGWIRVLHRVGWRRWVMNKLAMAILGMRCPVCLYMGERVLVLRSPDMLLAPRC